MSKEAAFREQNHECDSPFLSTLANLTMEDEGEGGSDDHSQSQLVLKEIRPFTIRADEFLNVDPKTSYYCRLHAVNIGVEKSKKFHRTLELTNALTEQLEHLERMKLNNEEFRDSLDHQLDALHVEKFAYTLFAKADAQDRKYKNRTKKIAKLYYVSANVFDVLRSMMSSTNDDDDDGGGGKEEGIDTATSPEIEEKQRYALWRAGEISKAIRLGVPCEDPPETSGKTTTTSRSESFKEDLDVDVDDERVEGEEEKEEDEMPPPPPPAVAHQPSPPPQGHKKGPPPGVGARAPPSLKKEGSATTTTVSTRAATNGANDAHRPDYEKIASAQTLAKSAVSALGFEDAKTAIEQLRAALEILESS